jgi:predicted kinase
MKDKATLYFFIGKMGAGKSTYSKTLTQETEALRISEDDWLSALYPNEIHNFDEFIVRHKRLLMLMETHVQQVLQLGVSVVMDFPGNTVDTRTWFKQVATSAGADHQGIYLQASDEVCLGRLSTRRAGLPERAKFDTPETFAAVTKFFEEPRESEDLNLIVIQQ